MLLYVTPLIMIHPLNAITFPSFTLDLDKSQIYVHLFQNSTAHH